jgi:hypothetical protein
MAGKILPTFGDFETWLPLNLRHRHASADLQFDTLSHGRTGLATGLGALSFEVTSQFTVTPPPRRFFSASTVCFAEAVVD